VSRPCFFNSVTCAVFNFVDTLLQSRQSRIASWSGVFGLEDYGFGLVGCVFGLADCVFGIEDYGFGLDGCVFGLENCVFYLEDNEWLWP